MALTANQQRAFFAGFRHGKTMVEKIGPWKALCEARGWKPSDDEQRHQCFADLGLPESLKAWKNSDFNKFLHHAETAYAAYKKTNPDERDRDRENLLYSIGKLADEAYIEKIATDKFGLGCWKHFRVDMLQQLRMTLEARTRSKKKREEIPPPRFQEPRSPLAPFLVLKEQPGKAGFLLVKTP